MKYVLASSVTLSFNKLPSIIEAGWSDYPLASRLSCCRARHYALPNCPAQVNLGVGQVNLCMHLLFGQVEFGSYWGPTSKYVTIGRVFHYIGRDATFPTFSGFPTF